MFEQHQFAFWRKYGCKLRYSKNRAEDLKHLFMYKAN